MLAHTQHSCCSTCSFPNSFYFVVSMDGAEDGKDNAIDQTTHAINVQDLGFVIYGRISMGILFSKLVDHLLMASKYDCLIVL